eukprot:g7821.t1
MVKLYFIKQKLSFDSSKNVLDDAKIIPAEQESGKKSSSMQQPLLQNQVPNLVMTEFDSSIDNGNDNNTVTNNIGGVSSQFEHQGYMIKLGRLAGRLSEKRRYFVLKGSKLYGFKDEQTCANMLKANNYSLKLVGANTSNDVKVINLVGYECMVNMDSMRRNYYPINLVSMDNNNSRGHKYFRVATEAEQKAWLRAFVIASLLPPK